MKNIRKNNLIRKIAIIILFIMCFNILIPNNNVTAKSYPDEGDDVGGSLFQPIMDFLVFLADSVLNVLQHNFIALHDVVYSQAESSSKSSFSWGWLGVALLGIAGIAYGVATIATGGLTTVITGIVISVAATAGTVHAFGEFADLLAGEFDIPFIAYNPYAIFSGEIPALDINFINPREGKIEKTLDSKLELYIETLFSGKYEYDTELIYTCYDLFNGSGKDAWGVINNATPTDNLNNVGLTREVLENESLNFIVYDDGNEYHKDSRFKNFIYLQEDSAFSEDEKNNIRKFLQHYDGKSNSFSFLIIWENEDLELNVFEIADTSR